jgi:hypothetical protein
MLLSPVIVSNLVPSLVELRKSSQFEHFLGLQSG